MRRHHRFEWDADKAETNLRKHGVRFDIAAEVLAGPHADRFQVEDYDDRHSAAEDRWLTTASHPADRQIVLRIIWTQRPGVCRIISARVATPRERKAYESQIHR